MKYTNLRRTSLLSSMFSNITIIVVLLFLAFFPNRPVAVQPVQAHGDDGHSHGRFGQITWVSVPGDPLNSARITFIAGFRRNANQCRNPLSAQVVPCSGAGGWPGVGDIFREDTGGTRIDNFGDGSTATGTLYFKVFSIHEDDNWLMARALQPGSATQEYIWHLFLGAKPSYLVYSASCCRTGPLAFPNAHINNPNANYRFETVVNFQTSASPISLLPPIVDCPKETVCRFTVSAIDPENPEQGNRRLSWKLASPTEMGGSDLTQPPNAEIDLETGVYTWDTRGINLGPEGYNTLYSTQVVIRDLDTDGIEISKVVLDFFIRIIDLPGPPEDVILIPMRWCGLSGSPSLEDPSLLNLGSPSSVLNRRMQELNGNIYIPQANIMFISGARTGVFPIIEGPNPDGHFFADIATADQDRDRAVNACRLAWRDKDPAVTGVIAINLNRFVNIVDGEYVPDTYPLGYADIPDINDLGEQLLRGVATVVDWAYLVENPDPSLPQPPPNAPDLLQKWLGHELGHGLSLRHVGEDSNNLMDCCASREITLTNEQKTRIRNQANRYIPDRVIYPYPLQQTPPTLGSSWPDNITDVPGTEAYVDMDNTAIGVEQDTAMTYLVASTFGLFPDNISNLNYFFSVDLDNNPATGGFPSTIGVPGQSQGIELVGRVQVNVTSGVAEGTPYVWKFQNGQFVQLLDSSIRAVVNTLYDVPGAASQTLSDTTPKGHIIQLLLSNDVRGLISENVNFDVAAQNTNTGTVDTVEGLITFIPPSFPSCQAVPDGTLLGSTINLTAHSLPANHPIQVFLGSQQLTAGTTNSSGDINIDVVIPADTTTGTRQLSAYADGTAVAADCVIQIWSYPKFDVPPSPVDGSSFTINIGETLEIPVQASDMDTEAGDAVTLDAIGLPPGASFPLSPPENPASATFSWTPTSNQEGSYVVVFTAQDSFGLATTPLSIIINVTANSLPSTPILDDFNRANGAIGSNWTGNPSKYAISSNQLLVTSNDANSDIYFSGQAFGADQEAYVTFANVHATAAEQDLILKSQSSTTWGSGMIEVLYDAPNQRVQVWTWEWPAGWAQHGADIPVTFVNGDTFGARALANGSVEVYKNAELLGTRDVTSWSYYAQGGYIGLWFVGAQNARLDDFGGGTLPSGMQARMERQAQVNTPSANAFDAQVGGTSAFWQGIPLSETASVTITQIQTGKQILPLKPKSNGVSGEDVVQVFYDLANGRIQVLVYDPAKGWTQIGKDFPVKFAVGDKFTIRAFTDGRLEILRNGKLIAKTDVTP